MYSKIPKKFAPPAASAHPHTIIDQAIKKSGCTPFRFFERATEVADTVPLGFDIVATVSDFDRFKGSRARDLEHYTAPLHVIRFAKLAAEHPAVLNCFKTRPATASHSRA